MAERLEQSEQPEQSEQHAHGAVGPIDEAVAKAPLEQGTDPLGDNARAYRRTSQLVLSGVIGVVFAVLAVIDVSSGHLGRGALATLIVVINAYVAAKEQRKPRRPSTTV